MVTESRWTMESFTSSDGLKLSYVVDDYTDPWRPRRRRLCCTPQWGACVGEKGVARLLLKHEGGK